MIRACFFDCFGVLYVKAGDVYFARFPEHHDELYDINKQADHGFIDRQDYISAVSKITGISEKETAQAFKDEYVPNLPLIEFTRSLKPRYKVGLISNIGRGWMQDFFDKHQLHDLFDAVLLSGEEGITKPNPRIFERAADRLSLMPAECIFIDDVPENCEGAKASGMHTLLYTTNEKLKVELQAALQDDKKEKAA